MTTSVAPADRLRESVAPFLSFFTGAYARLNAAPDVANFAVGNPQQMPLPAYVDALQGNLVPQDKDWFAYKLSEPESQRTSLTASDEMVEAGIPRFAAARREALG